MLGEAGLAAHDARPRPRQTEARRRHPAGGHPGSGHGSRRHGPHPDARPRRAASGCGWHTLPGWRSRSVPMSPMTRAGLRTAASRGAKWSGGMTLFDNRSPRIVVLRRKGRTFTDAGGACRAVIGCALAGGAGGLRPAASGPAAGAQAGFLAVLRLTIRPARRAITLRSIARATAIRTAAASPVVEGGCSSEKQGAPRPYAERCKLAPPHSIASLARARIDCGIVCAPRNMPDFEAVSERALIGRCALVGSFVQ